MFFAVEYDIMPSLRSMHAKKFLIVLMLTAHIMSSVSGKCSLIQKLTICSPGVKGNLALAFSVAVNSPAIGCKRMSNSEWQKVGCNNPKRDRETLICAPAKWSNALKLFADAVALKTKILFREPYNNKKLFTTSRGRALVRHELTHIRQQAKMSSYLFGYRYYTAYCKAGCSYSKNP